MKQNMRTMIKIRAASAFVAVLCCYATAARAEWKNSLKPSGNPAEQLQLVKSGQPRCVIQISEQPTPTETNAAAELQHWIHEMTDATLQITSDNIATNAIAIRTDRSLGDEGYSIAVSDGRIVLSGGKTRGVMNAVYALLEEDLGWRCYASGSFRVPRTNTLVIAPIVRRYIPQLRLRDPFYRCAFDPDWSLRNRCNAPRAKVSEDEGGHMNYGGMFVHTAAQIIPQEKYFKEHPEYFAQRKDGTRSTGQLCSTHPEVTKIATEYVLKQLKENPNMRIVSVSKNDGGEICCCERCSKLRDAEGSDMANQLVLVNKVAEAIEGAYPEVVVDTLAYGKTIQVPKTMRPRKNVVIRLCNDKVGSWKHPFTPAEQCEIGRITEQWSEAHNRIYIWDYTVNFSHYLAPMPNLDVMAANIRFWIKNHAEGVMLQGGYQGPAERDELKCWVTSKLMWDPSRDVKALVQDFVWGHYGKAAPALAEYENLLNQLSLDHASELASPVGGIRYPMDSPFFPKSFVTSATEIFRRAKELASHDEELTRRVERAELPILYLKCVRGREFIGEEYPQVVAEFERIARKEGITHLHEARPDFEKKIAAFKK